jgi:hypothetical protein
MNNFKIFYDSLAELSWFKSLSDHFNNADSYLIQSRGKNPPIIEDLIKYDKPDIILLNDNKPVLVLEITSEVPTGHNVGQRLARLVRAIEDEVFTIYYFPFDAKKHGEYSSICNLNIRLLKAFFKMSEIHNTPILAVNWLTDDNGEIITDGSENKKISYILNDYIENNFNYNSFEINEQLKYMEKEYNERLEVRPAYGHFPNSVKKYTTKEFCEKFDINKCTKKFKNRQFTYLYKIRMSPSKCKRQDPYTGTQFIYDYIACRNGKHVSDKKNNLVFYFPKISESTWFEKNPKDPTTKSSNWYLTTNAFLFKDDFVMNNLNEDIFE